MKSCRTCARAYCRTEQTKEWGYEMCGAGVRPIEMNLPDDCHCYLFAEASQEAIAERLPAKSMIVWGEDIYLD